MSGEMPDRLWIGNSKEDSIEYVRVDRYPREEDLLKYVESLNKYIESLNVDLAQSQAKNTELFKRLLAQSSLIEKLQDLLAKYQSDANLNKNPRLFEGHKKDSRPYDPKLCY